MVERTRNKYSRAVLKDGRIIIRLARNLTRSEEREHVGDLLKRMREQLKIEAKKIRIEPFSPLLDGAQSQTLKLPSGKHLTIVLRPGTRSRAVRSTRGWTVFIAPGLRRRGLHQLLWRIVSTEERRWAERLVDAINGETLGVHVAGVRLRFATSQWGSCSPTGVIMLNTALLFLPPTVLRYVVIHELAHRRRTDHSRMYWGIVRSAMPTFERARRALLNYRLPER